MSYVHVQQLISVRDEFVAARSAIAHLREEWSRLHDSEAFRPIQFAHVQVAARQLEDTYIIRLFAEFEGILRDFLPPPVGRPDRRAVFDLINRIALRKHIPNALREEVQAVREYRNLLAHRRAAGARAIPLQDALSSLNRYLAIL